MNTEAEHIQGPVDELRLKIRNVEHDLRSVKDLRAVKKRELEYNTEKVLDSEFKHQIDPLVAEYNKLSKDLQNERVRIRTETSLGSGPLPGDEMVEWENKNYARKWSKTGRIGIIQLWGPNSEKPANRSRYYNPEDGAKIIRILKKDGSHGLMWVHVTRDGWYPKGVNPNEIQS